MFLSEEHKKEIKRLREEADPRWGKKFKLDFHNLLVKYNEIIEVLKSEQKRLNAPVYFTGLSRKPEILQESIKLNSELLEMSKKISEDRVKINLSLEKPDLKSIITDFDCESLRKHLDEYYKAEKRNYDLINELQLLIKDSEALANKNKIKSNEMCICFLRTQCNGALAAGFGLDDAVENSSSEEIKKQRLDSTLKIEMIHEDFIQNKTVNATDDWAKKYDIFLRI